MFLACPEATGRWESPVSDDRTRPVAEKRRWNLSVSDRTLGFSVRSVRALPSEGVTAILAFGAIKECVAGLGLVAEHPHAYVACVGVLGCPLTHSCLQECESIVSECDSSALHCQIASSGTR